MVQCWLKCLSAACWSLYTKSGVILTFCTLSHKPVPIPQRFGVVYLHPCLLRYSRHSQQACFWCSCLCVGMSAPSLSETVILCFFISLFPPFLTLSVLLINFGTDFKTYSLQSFQCFGFCGEKSLETLFGSVPLLRWSWPWSFKKISDRYWLFCASKHTHPWRCLATVITYIFQGQRCVHVQYVLCQIYQTSHVSEMRQPTAHIWLTFEMFRLIFCFLY